jgi:hypothetical protein
MAFLVAIIPGPVKYQRSIAGGVPTAFLDGLMGNLLAKLHTTGALDAAAFDAALTEPLGLVGESEPLPPVEQAGGASPAPALTDPGAADSLPSTGPR